MESDTHKTLRVSLEVFNRLILLNKKSMNEAIKYLLGFEDSLNPKQRFEKAETDINELKGRVHTLELR